jgi:hypothetical protein
MCVVETNVWNASITHRRDAAQAIEALAAYSVQRGHDAASFGDSADRRMSSWHHMMGTPDRQRLVA